MGRQIIHTEFQCETPWKITSSMTKKEVKHYVTILEKLFLWIELAAVWFRFISNGRLGYLWCASTSLY
jgi:hypothetical protein